MTLKEQVEQITKDYEEIKEKYPHINSLKAQLENCNLEEMREHAVYQNGLNNWGIKNEVTYCEVSEKMVLQVTLNYIDYIYLYSPKLKVKTHYVIEDVIKNI